MKKSCRQCRNIFKIFDEDRPFLESVAPVFEGKKYEIPTPEICPDCRQQRRLAFCNERNLYPGVCSMCNKRILTEHPPDVNQPFYCRECFVSDKYDPRDYGRDFDFSRTFFEQFYELMRSVPMMALNTSGTIQNCDYVHYTGQSKNCYLIAHADFCEDCMYGYGFKENRSCLDGFYNLHDELCYDCVDCHKSYGLKSCQDCQNCHCSAFLRDCTGCKDCFLCVGLKGKQYCFENKQLSKEQYDLKMRDVDLGSYAEYQKFKGRLRELEKVHSFKEFQGHNLQNCLGNYLYNCKDCFYCFDCEDVEWGRYCFQLVLGSKNNMDVYQYGTGLQQSYETTIGGDHSYHVLFSHEVFINCSDIYYCTHAHSSRNCFGSTCLKQNQYLILNKQYSETEYNKLVPRIIEHMRGTGEWGNYFPGKYSLFGYNKTSAQMYFPLKRQEAVEKGWKWDDYEPAAASVSVKLRAEEVADNIADAGEDILNVAIECEVTGKLFKIMPLELQFYRKQRIPIPRRSPEQRHLDRFSLRSPRKFWKRTCGKCGSSLTTVRQEGKVYCERCYLGEAF